MNLLNIFALIIIVWGLPTETRAESKDADWATNELSSEMIECGQYFLIASTCIKNFPNPQAATVASDYRAASDQITQFAYEIGKSVGLTAEALAARMRLANSQLLKNTNNNCTNISILQERYATFCNNLKQHPQQRLGQLVECSRKNNTLPCGDH
jgi:hypothetical protein